MLRLLLSDGKILVAELSRQAQADPRHPDGPSSRLGEHPSPVGQRQADPEEDIPCQVRPLPDSLKTTGLLDIVP